MGRMTHLTPLATVFIGSICQSKALHVILTFSPSFFPLPLSSSLVPPVAEQLAPTSAPPLAQTTHGDGAAAFADLGGSGAPALADCSSTCTPPTRPVGA